MPHHTWEIGPCKEEYAKGAVAPWPAWISISRNTLARINSCICCTYILIEQNIITIIQPERNPQGLGIFLIKYENGQYTNDATVGFPWLVFATMSWILYISNTDHFSYWCRTMVRKSFSISTVALNNTTGPFSRQILSLSCSLDINYDIIHISRNRFFGNVSDVVGINNTFCWLNLCFSAVCSFMITHIK